MWVNFKPVDIGCRSIYMMLIHESHVFELEIETMFEACDPRSFFNATYVVTRKA